MSKLWVMFALAIVLIQSPVALAQDMPRFRGVVISPTVTAADLEYLRNNWNVNFINWQLTLSLTASVANAATLDQYDAWLDTALQKLDALLPVCSKLGIRVMVSLYTTPGGRNASSQSRIFTDPVCQARYLQVWKKIAARYSANPTVWGYDLAGEPIEGSIASGMMNWNQLATQAALTVRSVDQGHVIVVEPPKWALPESFVNFAPLPASVTNVVYCVHMYNPHKFTHQGLTGNDGRFRYPGVVDGKMWSKAELVRNLQPVVDFQKRYGARVLVGEFSAIRWAVGGSAYNYLKDVIDVFEQNGWGWAYHAFREFDGWSVEHTEDKNNHEPARTRTNRERLLRSWFSKNS